MLNVRDRLKKNFFFGQKKNKGKFTVKNECTGKSKIHGKSKLKGRVYGLLKSSTGHRGMTVFLLAQFWKCDSEQFVFLNPFTKTKNLPSSTQTDQKKQIKKKNEGVLIILIH